MGSEANQWGIVTEISSGPSIKLRRIKESLSEDVPYEQRPAASEGTPQETS